jgi:hypothetical protein
MSNRTIVVSLDGAEFIAEYNMVKLDRATAYRMMLAIGMALASTDGAFDNPEGSRLPDIESDERLPPLVRG